MLGGVIRFFDPKIGKKLREIQVEKGRLNYDIQKVLLAPDGSWLAYVNQDNGKVLDLRNGSPKAIADLGDGYDMALSPDQTALWVIDRSKIFGLKVNDWSPVGTVSLLDQVKPDQTPNLHSPVERQFDCGIHSLSERVAQVRSALSSRS